MPVTQRQINELASYLEGDRPTHQNVDRDTGTVTREWNLLCPLHDDHKRSASINIDKGVFYCNKCGGMPVTALIRRKNEWRTVNANGKVAPSVNGSAPDSKQRTLSEGMVAGWHSALMSNGPALQWLRERRGLLPETLVRFQIGMDNGKYYTIPVRDEEGQIVNVRFYDPNPGSERRKIWSESGYGSPPRLYPIQVLKGDPDEVGIVAGEWDALLAIQNDFEVVTRTAGENQWDLAWGHWFKDRDVWICQDADDEGENGNKKIARAIEKVVQSLKVLSLPYEHQVKHGSDITDLLLDHGPNELRELISKTPYWKASRTATARQSGRENGGSPETVTVLDTFDARRVGEPVRVIVTVKGRQEPGYSVPKRVNLVCSMDVGAKCNICPMRAANGEATVDIQRDDPVILEMMESSSFALQSVIANAYGVPGGKCIKLQQEVEEYQAVEVLFARPALDYSDGSEVDPQHSVQYKNVRITAVGRHDTAANNTVAVVGALQPDPRKQTNQFLAHDLEMLETSVDRFVLDDRSIDLMRRFQGERPLHKLADINRALAQHVTRIHGRSEMHALMDLVFHSVLSFKFAGEYVNRGWLEALIVGDTRTGKSLAAQRLVHHYGGGEIISCEAASFAGIVGGLQQMSGKEWAVTWGVVPINDKRLVVMDEISGLTQEEIAQMSDIRSSGQAKLIKIQQETTWARTRLLWLGNPRNSTMANYTYGVDAIKPLIGNAEDIARFDLAMAVTLFDVQAEIINQPSLGGELHYTAEACHNLLMWAWTRTVDQIIWAPGSEERIFDRANQLGKLYIEDPPLVQAANIRIKIARVAVAIAARLFSTDSHDRELLVVRPEHVEAAAQFINLIYGMPAFGYRERSREQLADRLVAEQNKDKIGQYLKGRPMLSKFLRTTGKFRRPDLEEIMNITREEANGIISTLYEARMVRKVLGDIVVEPTMHALLREMKW